MIFFIGLLHPIQYRWHTVVIGRPYCEGPDHERLTVHQTLRERDEGMGGKTHLYAGHHGRMVEGKFFVMLDNGNI